MANVDLLKAKNKFFIALGIDMSASVIAGLLGMWTIGVLNDIRYGRRTYTEDLAGALGFIDQVSWVLLAPMIGVGITLLMWLNACYKFLKQDIGVQGFRQESWVGAAWIIPVLNLFKPYQVINEIYRAGSSRFQPPDGWKKESGSGLILLWWIFYAITHIVFFIIGKDSFKQSFRGDLTFEQIIGLIDIQVWTCGYSVVIAGLWFVLANHLTDRLLARQAIRARTAPSMESAGIDRVEPPRRASFHESSYRDGSTSATPILTGAASTAAHSRPSAAPTSSKSVADRPDSAHQDYRFFEEALAEYDSEGRQKGLWAKLFSESEGDERKVKANYLRIRSHEIRAQHASRSARNISSRQCLTDGLFAQSQAGKLSIFELFNGNFAILFQGHYRVYASQNDLQKAIGLIENGLTEVKGEIIEEIKTMK